MGKNKRPYKLAYHVAMQVRGSLAGYCERIEIAGSIRRRVPLCGDIELVAIPTMHAEYDLFNNLVDKHNRLWEQLDKLMYEGKIFHAEPQRWGDKYRAFNFQTKNTDFWKVDLFTCQADNWGDTFLIRTGARDFSKWMVTPQKHGGALPDDMKHHQNMLWLLGSSGEMLEVHQLYEEQDWFDLCGLPFIPPEYRDEDRWLSYLKQ